MRHTTAIQILVKGVHLTLQNFLSAIVIILISSFVVVGPILALALGAGYLAQHPELAGTQGPDGELNLTWLGHFIMWHNHNHWLIPSFALALVYCSFSWLCIAWFRRLSGMQWLLVPWKAWVGGIVILFVIINGRHYLASLYPSNQMATDFSIAATIAFVGFRFAPAWVRVCSGGLLHFRMTFERLKPYGALIFWLTMFFALAEFGLGELEGYLDQRNIGTTLLEYSVKALWLLQEFWFLSTVFLLGQELEAEAEMAEDSSAN